MEERHILELDSGGSYMTRFSCQDSQNYMVEWVNFTLYIYINYTLINLTLKKDIVYTDNEYVLLDY